MNLASKAVRAAKHSYLGVLIRVAATLVAQVLIMRELGPELVGAFGYALLLYGVLALVIDQGLGWSLVQADLNDKEEIGTAFTRLLLASALSGLFVYALSYPAETFLDDKLVGEVLRLSAPSYLLIGLLVIPQAKLRAELRFREIQIATTGAYIIAYPLVGVGMAYAGFGTWALVAAWYVQAFIQVLIAYSYFPHSLRVANPFRPSKSGALGRYVAGINVANWAIDNAGGVFVGGMGPSALGYFNAAWMVARPIALHAVQTLQSILFSAASAVAEENELIRRIYLGALGSTSFVLLPVYAYAATHADFLVGMLLGEKWLGSAGVFAALALAMPPFAFGVLSGAILTASARGKDVFRSQIGSLCLMLVGLALTINADLSLVGWVIAAAYAFRFVLQAWAISRRAAISSSEFISVFRGPVVIAAFVSLPPSLLLSTTMDRYLLEGMSLGLKLGIVVLLFRLLPAFFFGDPVVDVIRRFSMGRNMLAFLRVSRIAA